MRSQDTTYRKIKLCLRNIIPGIRRLHHHLLPSQLRARERQLITRATAGVAAGHGCEAVGQVLVDSPGGLGRAGKGVAALAARLGVWVGERVVVDVTDGDDASGLAFAFPSAGRFAAVLLGLGCQ